LDADLQTQEATLKKFNTQITTAQGNISGLTTSLGDCKTKVANLEQAFKNQSAEEQAKAYQELRTQAEALGIDISEIPLEATEANVTALTAKF
jgi:chromosome segregation ATPase